MRKVVLDDGNSTQVLTMCCPDPPESDVLVMTKATGERRELVFRGYDREGRPQYAVLR